MNLFSFKTLNETKGPTEKADFTFFLNHVPQIVETQKYTKNKNGLKKRHYFMVYAMESEPHSGGGDTWHLADFCMWYNLKLSYPAPATYFDVKFFLPKLLAPPLVKFKDKEQSAPVVWVLSNCNAYNAREKFVQRLMQLIKVDSYGNCMRNKRGHTSARMQGNIELYAKYKFVLAIENSNCEDYITEKLVHSVASGSIPIVAGKNNKPNYASFMPKNSYINVYDFKSVEDLANYLAYLSQNQTAYESYISFRLVHNFTHEYFKIFNSLNEMIESSKLILPYENNKEFYDGLISNEKSESKVCKLGRYLQENSEEKIEKEIEANRMNRLSVNTACLPHGNLASDFKV